MNERRLLAICAALLLALPSVGDAQDVTLRAEYTHIWFWAWDVAV